MTRDISREFLRKPPLWRMVLLLGVGLPLILLGYLHGRSFRPPELTGSLVDTGLGKVHDVIELVGNSDFGRSETDPVDSPEEESG